ncbi:MAG: Mur ligase family protein [Candidatus Margulisbacteria bacterium]|nr:Mur ligase family protein [Candidatus Margulisiibacteriota bacterium]
MNIEDQLYELAKNSGINYDLTHIVNALELLDNPHLGINYIHIAGTNGKGTTADFIAQSLESYNKKIGVYTSPHLFSYTERFQINGTPISIRDIDSYLKIIKSKITAISLTEFEILTLIAFMYFRDEMVDYVVLETGLGGRLDATNVVSPILTVITTISFDHQAILGNTLLKIAGEKLGIMKPHIPLVTFEQKPEINLLFEKKAQELNCPIFFVQPTASEYLSNNKLLADKALSLLGFPSIKINTTRQIGRMQQISKSPLIIADAAHNIEGITNIVNYIKKNNLKTDILFSVSQKPREDILLIVETLASVAKTLYITEFDFYKAVPLATLLEITKNISNLKVIPKNKAKDFIAETKNNLIITGSIYFLGSVL